MRIVMVDCVNTILREIAMPEMNQRDIAQTYALMMQSAEDIDWSKVNAAIMERWSKAGLIRIKTMAHNGSCFNETA